jgi:hypothetical protein
MGKRRPGLVAVLVVAVTTVLVGGYGTASATDSSSSAHYEVSETHIGSGSIQNDCSHSYCSKLSLGDLAVGSGSSNSYSAQFGSNTTAVPSLQVIIVAGTQNLGVLSTEKTATATATIKVRNYLSGGYRLLITGNPPSQGTHQLATTQVATGSRAGVEQFGVNLVANSHPQIGTNPLQVPSTATSFGMPTSDYALADNFKYRSGDVVASSDTSSGETDYTLSMVVNIGDGTPEGHYKASLSAVVVPVY